MRFTSCERRPEEDMFKRFWKNIQSFVATFRMLQNCGWRYCSISRNVWGSFCLGKDWWCGEYQSKQDGWLTRGERQITVKEYSISKKYMFDSTTRLRCALHLGASGTLNSLARNWCDAGICRRYAIDSGTIWYMAIWCYLQKLAFHMSIYFSNLPPERTAVQQWNLQLLWAWLSSCLGEPT